MPRTPNTVFTQGLEKMKCLGGEKTCFQLIDFLNKPTGLSQSAMKSRIGVIKDFYKSSILEIGIQSLLSMVTGRGFTYEVVLHTNLLYS